MLKIFLFVPRTFGVTPVNNYEHFQTNEGLNFPYKNLNIEFLNNEIPEWWPFQTFGSYNFCPEGYLAQNFEDYHWVEARWLPFFISVKNDGSSLLSFFANEKLVKDWGENLKLIKIENWGFEEVVKNEVINGYPQVVSRNIWKRIGLPQYFRSEAPVWDNAVNDDTLSYRWLFGLDFWFTYWWIWFHACREQKLKVKFLLKETEPVSSWGTDLAIVNGFWDLYQTTYDLQKLAEYNIDPDNFLTSSKSVILTYISQYPKYQKTNLWVFMNTAFKKIYPQLPDNDLQYIFNTDILFGLIFQKDDNDQWVFDNSLIKKLVVNNGQGINVDFQKDIWFNYNTEEELSRIVSGRDLNIDSVRFQKMNEIHDMGYFAPVQMMSNLALLSESSFPFLNGVYRTSVDGSNITQSAFYKYQDMESLLNENKYKLSNGMFLYLVIAPEMFINFQNFEATAAVPADAGLILPNATGSYFCVTPPPPAPRKSEDSKKEAVSSYFLRNIDMKNASFLLPIPNNYDFLVKDQVAGQAFSFSIDNFLSVFGSQFGLLTFKLQINEKDVIVQVNPGEFEKNVKNIVMISKSPKILQGLALNTTNQTIDNCSAIFDQGTACNALLLGFFGNKTNPSDENYPVYYFPAIYFSDSSIYCIYETNLIDTFKNYNIHFFDRLYDFTNGDFSRWTADTEPYLISPMVLQSFIMLSKEQGQSAQLNASQLDLTYFNTEPWTFGVMFNFFTNNINCKISLNELKNRNYIWDETETDLFFVDKRAVPVMVSGANEQMKQQQLINNTGISVQQKEFDFTELWNKKQRKMEVVGNWLSGVGGVLSGAATGAQGGALIGSAAGPVGALAGAGIGAAAGAVGGILSGVGEAIRLDFENKNRIAALDLERQIAFSGNLAKMLSYSNLPNTKLLDGNIAFMQKCFNPNVKNQEFFFDNFKTLDLIPEKKEQILNQAKMWGRHFPYWGTFDQFDVMESQNFFALDKNSGMDGEYIFEIQKWLDENLKSDWSFAEFTSSDLISVFLQKIYGGMRLYSDILDDTESLSKKRSKSVSKKIGDGSLLFEDDPALQGRARIIDPLNMFNTNNFVKDFSTEQFENIYRDDYFWEGLVDGKFSPTDKDPTEGILPGVVAQSGPGWIVFDADTGTYYINCGTDSGNWVETKNLILPKNFFYQGGYYNPDLNRSDFTYVYNSEGIKVELTENDFVGFKNLQFARTTKIEVVGQQDHVGVFAYEGFLEKNTSVVEVGLPPFIDQIPARCFANSTIKNFTITSTKSEYLNIVEIGDYAFAKNIAPVTFTGNTLLGEGCFQGASYKNFSKIQMTLSKNGSAFCFQDAKLFLWDRAEVFHQKIIGESFAEEFEIKNLLPEEFPKIYWEGVQEIGTRAFFHSAFCLERILLPNSLTKIGVRAFWGIYTKVITVDKNTENWYVNYKNTLNLDRVFMKIFGDTDPETYDARDGTGYLYDENPQCSWGTVCFSKIQIGLNFIFKKCTWEVLPMGDKKVGDFYLSGWDLGDILQKNGYQVEVQIEDVKGEGKGSWANYWQPAGNWTNNWGFYDKIKPTTQTNWTVNFWNLNFSQWAFLNGQGAQGAERWALSKSSDFLKNRDWDVLVWKWLDEHSADGTPKKMSYMDW